jgi:hypothetical protein
MEYHLEAEVIPPNESPELDPLQRQGVVSLLDEQLELLAGIEGPDGMEIEPLDHRVTAHGRGASITWIVDAPALLFAEEAARHVLAELLERAELLAEWTVARCEVTVSDDELATALASTVDEPHHVNAMIGRSEEDVTRRLDDLQRSAERLKAFDAEAFGYGAIQGVDDNEVGDNGVDEDSATLIAGTLIQAMEVMTEELFQDVRTLEETEEAADGYDALWVLGDLPDYFAHCYTALFAKKFLVTTAILGHRLAQPTWTPTLSTAEALALHVLKSRAMQQLQLEGLVDEETIKRAFAAFDEHAFDNLDHELLYENSSAENSSAENSSAENSSAENSSAENSSADHDRTDHNRADLDTVNGWFHARADSTSGLNPYLHLEDDTLD